MLIKSVHVNLYANASLKIFVILFKVTLKSMITKWVQETINQCLVKLPKIRTEYARKSFRFMGAKIYNELPVNIRKTESFKTYEQYLKQHFT